MTDPIPTLGISLLTQSGRGLGEARPPRTALEQAVVDIWRQVLPAESFSADSDFFDLGGDSLMAMQIVARVQQVFEVGLDVTRLLDAPTPAALAALVEQALAAGDGSPAAPGPAAFAATLDRAVPRPLSFTQERMWFIHQMAPDNLAYNISGAVRLRGPFHLAALDAAFTEVIRRHEILRTTFQMTPSGEPRQVVGAPLSFHVQVVEVAVRGDAADDDGADGDASRGEDAAGGDALAEALAGADAAARQPFDLARGPLLRATTFRLSAEDQVLLFELHHIVADAWSMGVLAREIITMYQAARGGQAEGAHVGAERPQQAAQQEGAHIGAERPQQAAKDGGHAGAAQQEGAHIGAERPPQAAQDGGHAGAAQQEGAHTGAERPQQAAQEGGHLGAERPLLPPLPMQFGDYAAWQRAAQTGAVRAGDLIYWRQKLAGLTVLELPLDHPRPGVQTYHGALASAELHPDVLGRLRALCQPASATLSMILQAVFQVLLLRYTGQTDVAVGLPIANRRDVDVEGLIGPFVNTLILRTDLSGNPSFRAALARVRQVSLEAYAHQDQPFAQLVAELNPERSLSRGPLAQVMFNHINVPLPANSLRGLRSDYVALDRGAAQFDLTLTVLDTKRGRAQANQPERLIVEYNTDLFEPASAARLLRHYTNLLRAIAADPDQPILSLPLLDHAERRQMLFDWNDTARPYPAASLAELFETQAARTPAAPALLAGDQALSYTALNARANQIARHLRQLGLGLGAVVGVCLERSFEQMAALLGVLKAGAAYLPLDPAYPAERLRDMLVDSGATGVIIAADPSPLPAGHSTPTIPLSACSGYSSANLGLAIPPDAPAYLIYTSGSTGRPKGVLATQRGAVNHCQWVWDNCPFAPGEVAAHKTSLNFVDAVVEIFAPLLAGVPLLLVPEAVARDPARLVDALARQQVTRLAVVLPALLRALLQCAPDLAARLPRLRLVAAGGEPVDAALVEQFEAALPGVALHNWYGSSEVAGDATTFDCARPRPAGVVPVGRPLSNMQVYVLDPRTLEPAPIGVVGEVFAGGAGLALGYHRRPALTAERFVPDPFSALPGARLYRTGDLGRWLPDGNLLVLGRRDRQVKVRGVRVELDEVQAVLARHLAVAECAVSARADARAGGGTELAAYYAARPGAALTPAELRRHLAAHLPESMLPAWLVPLPALPRLPNGKLDAAALPAPDPSAARASAAAYALPRTLLESSLAQLWAESLGLATPGTAVPRAAANGAAAVGAPTVGVHDNFFELGGHSLLAAALFARLKSQLGLDLPLAALFAAPTVAGLAAAIVSAGQAPARLSSLVPLKPSGERPPLFCVHPLGGGVGDYAALARHLHPQQPFYGLRAKGLDDERYQAAAFEDLAADYLAEVRALQPAGPYYLAGYSSGGLIAFEMARQLTAAGQAVALLALLDSYAPAAPGAAGPRLGALLNAAASLPHWLADLRRLPRQQLAARIRRWRLARQGATLTAADYLGQAEMAALPPHHRAFIEAHWLALAAYRPRPWVGAVTLFRAQAQALSRAADPDKGWRPLALGGVAVREFPGSHRTLLDEPWVAGLAAVVQARLDEIAELAGQPATGIRA